MLLNVSTRYDSLKKHEFCYCSLLYDEGLITELRVLGKSILNTNAGQFKGVDVPKFVIVTTPGVSFETRVILQKEKWIILPLNTIIRQNSPRRWRYVYTKLHVFSLHRYGCSKVAFIDADVMFVRNPTPLLVTCPGFCATMKHSNRFNSGVFVLTPGEDILQNMTVSMSTVGTYEGSDQGMLNEMYPHLVDAPPIGGLPCNDRLQTQGQARLPPGFNADIGGFITTGRWAHPGGNNGEDELYIVHYTLAAFKPHMSWLWWFTPTFQAYGWHTYVIELNPKPTGGIGMLIQSCIAVGLLFFVNIVQRYMSVCTRSKEDFDIFNDFRIIIGQYTYIIFLLTPSSILIAIMCLTPLEELPIGFEATKWWVMYALVTHMALMEFIFAVFASNQIRHDFCALLSIFSVTIAIIITSVYSTIYRISSCIIGLVFVLPLCSLILNPYITKKINSSSMTFNCNSVFEVLKFCYNKRKRRYIFGVVVSFFIILIIKNPQFMHTET